MAPPPSSETSSKSNEDKKKKNFQSKTEEKLKRSIQKRKKFLKDLRRRSSMKRKLIAREVLNIPLLNMRLFFSFSGDQQALIESNKDYFADESSRK